MIGRCKLGLLFPQFNGQLRITFQADAPGFLCEVPRLNKPIHMIVNH